MKGKPKMSCRVSIIIPVYNAEKYLSECLKSLCAQTVRDLEILCVDDRSQDGSLALLRRMSADDSRIKVIEMDENGGAGAARNRALEQAEGEYVAFVDADDFLPDNEVYEQLIKAVENSGLPIAGGCIAEYRDGKIEHDVWAGMQFEKDGPMHFSEWACDYGFTRFIYRRDFLQLHHLKFPEIRFYEDPPFLVKSLCAAERFCALTRCVYCYRCETAKCLNANQLVLCLTGMRDNLKVMQNFGMGERLGKIYLERLEDFTEDTLGDLLLANLSPEYPELLRLLLEIHELLPRMPLPLHLILSGVPLQRRLCRWFNVEPPGLNELWNRRSFTVLRYLRRPEQFFRCLSENGLSAFIQKIRAKKG